MMLNKKLKNFNLQIILTSSTKINSMNRTKHIELFEEFNILNENISRCTNNVFYRITGEQCEDKLTYGTSLLNALKKYGYKWQPIYFEYWGKTLNEFFNDVKEGTYYITTKNHALAYIDGNVYDIHPGNRKKNHFYI